MAPIAATIHISFISNYAGPHRICWRINNTGPYDCSTIVNCTGGGNPCSADISVIVDNETCNPVEFDGYVQATCEVAGSLSGRTTFSTIFTPNPTCKSFQVLCNAVGVASATVNIHGSGYNPGVPPSVTITGGGGTGATAVAVIGNAGVKTWTITNGGAGYDSGGSAVFLNVASTGGTGTGAFFNVTVTLGVITSIVLSSSPTSPGSGYLVGDTLSFGNLGGTGAGTAVITINSLNTSEVQYISMTANGSGYSSQATVTIGSPVGFGGFPDIQATATAVMGTCPEFSTTDCDGTIQGGTPVDLGVAYNLCSTVAPVPPIQYQVTPLGCCYDCVSVTFTATVADVTLTATSCATLHLITINLVVGVPQTFCVVRNSWHWTPLSSSVTVLVGATCP